MITPEEKKIIQYGKEQGKSREDVLAALALFRQDQAPKAQGSPIKKVKENFDNPLQREFATQQETISDIKETGKGIFSQFKEAGEDIVDIAKDEDLSFGEKVRGGLSRAFSGGARAVFEEPTKGAVKVALSQENEDKLKSKAGEVGEKIADTELVQNIAGWYSEQSPDTQREIKNALGFAEGLLEIGGVGKLLNLTNKGLNKVTDYVTRVDDAARLTDEPVEQAVKQVESPRFEPDDFTDPKLSEQARIRAEAEANAPDVSFREKSIGLTQSDKAQILGKTDKMQEYIDVVQTRNATKEAPTVMEFAGDSVRNAADEMENLLKETGSSIGQTRQKLSSVRAPIDSVKQIENTFTQQLDSLGLKLNNNGQVVRKPGVVSRVGTQSDVRTMQELWDEFKLVKQSPTLENLIDYRNLVQQNIEFGKSAREVSNALNRPAQNIRGEIKKVTDNLVGKSGAKDLEDYTNFINAYNEIKTFTDRRAGGEYLLKLLESGRGGEARQVVDTIKRYTGIDLQDDATMMRLVTNLLADDSQKTLFKQEITSAGLDTARILSGDKMALGEKVFGAVMDRIADPEKVLIDATRIQQ